MNSVCVTSLKDGMQPYARACPHGLELCAGVLVVAHADVLSRPFQGPLSLSSGPKHVATALLLFAQHAATV